MKAKWSVKNRLRNMKLTKTIGKKWDKRKKRKKRERRKQKPEIEEREIRA